MIAAAGLTVSHYSSTAVAAALLMGAWILRGVRLRADRRGATTPRRLPSLGLAAGTTLAMAVGWAAVTGSASTFATDLAATAKAIAAQAMVLSDATRYSPIRSGVPVDDATALKVYTAGFTDLRVEQGARPAPAGCEPTLLPADTLPTTRAGAALADVGAPPGQVNAGLRRAFVVLFEGGAVLGCVLLWWRARRSRRVPRPAAAILAELGTAGIGLLAVSLVAPQLTDSYGLLRLYQQMLPFLGVAVVVALVVPLRWVLRRQSIVYAVSTAIVAGCLVTTSGLLPRVTGGFPPQLNLANGGPYYRAYLRRRRRPDRRGVDRRPHVDQHLGGGRQPGRGEPACPHRPDAGRGTDAGRGSRRRVRRGHHARPAARGGHRGGR